MKLNKEFLPHNSGNESILVPTGNAPFSGIVRGNKTLGAILEFLKTDTTEEEIIKKMTDRFDAPEETLRQAVEKTLAELRKIGALDE